MQATLEPGSFTGINRVLGPAVLEIFSNRDLYAGKSLPVIGDIISLQEVVDTFMRVTGKKAVYASAFTREDFLHHFPEFGSNEMLVREIMGMVEYAVEYGYFRKDRDLLWSRRVNSGSVTWEEFLPHGFYALHLQVYYLRAAKLTLAIGLTMAAHKCKFSID